MFLNCRQLTDSAAGKDAGGNVTSIADKFLRSMNDLRKAKMSMPNQWKLLSQLKDYLNKANYDKNQQIIVPKDWLDSLQKLTYSQLETIRKLSSSGSDTSKTTDAKTSDKNSNTKHKDGNDLENAKTLISEQAASLEPDSTAVQPRTQQVIICKLIEAIIGFMCFLRDKLIPLRSRFVSKVHPTIIK